MKYKKVKVKVKERERREKKDKEKEERPVQTQARENSSEASGEVDAIKEERLYLWDESGQVWRDEGG